MSSLRDVLSHVFLHSQAAAAATVLSGTLVPASEIASRHAEDDAERSRLPEAHAGAPPSPGTAHSDRRRSRRRGRASPLSGWLERPTPPPGVGLVVDVDRAVRFDQDVRDDLVSFLHARLGFDGRGVFCGHGRFGRTRGEQERERGEGRGEGSGKRGCEVRLLRGDQSPCPEGSRSGHRRDGKQSAAPAAPHLEEQRSVGGRGRCRAARALGPGAMLPAPTAR